MMDGCNCFAHPTVGLALAWMVPIVGVIVIAHPTVGLALAWMVPIGGISGVVVFAAVVGIGDANIVNVDAIVIIVALAGAKQLPAIDTVGAIDGRGTIEERGIDPWGTCFAPTVDGVVDVVAIVGIAPCPR